MRIRVFLLLAACLLLPLAASAQAPTVEVGKAYKVAFDAVGGPLINGYRLYVCPGTVTDCTSKVGADIPASALQAGVVTVDVTAVAQRGNYTVLASAFNADKEAKSPPLTYQAQLAAPPAPSQPRLVIVASLDADGHAVFDWRFVDADTVERLLASR